MPYKKTHPGLDAVLDDAALDRFIHGIPLALEEPPRRVWPAVLAGVTAAVLVGILLGVLVAPYVTVTQTLIVVAAVQVAVVCIIRADD